MQDCASSERSKRDVPGHATAIISRGAGLPHEEDLKGAAEILNSSGNVAILAGRGALGATEELEDIAEILGAPIVKALLGKGAVPDDSPYTTGGIGLLGTRASQEALEQCTRF
jgi:pyruvate dehydrogenase (quinone)